MKHNFSMFIVLLVILTLIPHVTADGNLTERAINGQFDQVNITYEEKLELEDLFIFDPSWPDGWYDTNEGYCNMYWEPNDWNNEQSGFHTTVYLLHDGDGGGAYTTLNATGGQYVEIKLGNAGNEDVAVYLDNVLIGTVAGDSSTERFNISSGEWTSSSVLKFNSTGDGWSSSLVRSISLMAIDTQSTPSEPVADFTSNITSGYSPLWVQFNDTSSGSPTSWLWDFGDGYTSTLQNCSHEYTSPGTYTVSLRVENSAGNDTKTDNIIVEKYRVYAEVGDNSVEGEGCYDMAYGFWSTIKDAENGYVVWGDWQNGNDIIDCYSSQESHWNETTSSSQWIENADFVYFSGHGSAYSGNSMIWFTYPDENSGLYYADSSNMNLGAGRTKWVVLDSCLCLNSTYWHNWDDAIDGLHVLLGWNTTSVPSYDSGGDGRGKIFAELIRGIYPENDSALTIIDAWEWAGKYTWGHHPQYSYSTDIFNGVIFDSYCENDHLPGWGSFSSSTSGSLNYRSILIFNQTVLENESKSASRLLNVAEGRYSITAAVPAEDTIMVYKPVESGYSREWAATLEKNLGMSGDVEQFDELYYADSADSEDYYFVVEKDTSTISFQKFNGRTGFPNSKTDYISAANSFLEKNGLMTSEVQSPGISNNGEESLTKSGDRKPEWKTTVVTYSREIDGLPVWNCQKMVELDSGGNVIGYFQNWRNYEPYKEYELKSPEKAFEEFMAKENSVTKGSSPDSIVVTDVILGYYSQPAASDEKYLQPIYVFEGYSQYGKSMEEFEPIMISAID